MDSVIRTIIDEKLSITNANDDVVQFDTISQELRAGNGGFRY